MLGSLAVKALPILLIPTSNIGGSNILLSKYVKTQFNENGFKNVEVMEWSVLRQLRILDIETYLEVLFSPNPDSSEFILQNKAKSSAVIIFVSPYFNGFLPGNAKLMMDWIGVRQAGGGTIFNDKIVEIASITGQRAVSNLGKVCGCDCKDCGCDRKDCGCDSKSMSDGFHAIMLETCDDLFGKYLKGNVPLEIYGNFNPEDPNGPGPYTLALMGKNKGSKEQLELRTKVSNFISGINATMHKHISASNDVSWSVSYQ